MRLCIIGNSHLAAPKLGWDDVRREFPDTEVTFFGAAGQALNDVQLRDGILSAEQVRGRVHNTSGGSALHLDVYDCVFLVGLNLSIMHVVNLYESFRTDEHNGRD